MQMVMTDDKDHKKMLFLRFCSVQLIISLVFSKNLKSPTEGLFTQTISVPVSDTVTLKVYHCAYGNGAFDGQIGFETHSVH